MTATSTDLVHWTKTGKQLVPPQEGYDPDDWRDPFVLWDEGTQRYVMILGARAAGEKILTGRTVYFTSTDLESWEFQGDFWAPGIFSMHEMPDLFRMGDWWYLLTTEYSDKSKTVYRMSRSLSGPWTAPADDAFDGRAYYAARSCADDEGRRYLFGWVPTKEDEDDLAKWQWGGTLVVHEVTQRADGSLAVSIPTGATRAFGTPEPLAADGIEIDAVDGLAEAELTPASGDFFRLQADIQVRPGTRSVSLRLFEDAATGDGYEFLLSVADQRLSFDRRPNYPWYRYDNRGLDRPLPLAPDTTYHLDLIADDTICTLYVDGVALNARMYAKPGTSMSVQVVDGGLRLTDASISR